MKRSEINIAIKLAKEVLTANKFHLPYFAYWSKVDWSKAGKEYNKVRLNGFGWDVTDFGSGNFDRIGTVLFTIRNGSIYNIGQGTPYAEKIIILKPGQMIPLHFHWSKTEDIINRGNGILNLQLFNSKEDEGVDYATSVRTVCDGCEKVFDYGEIIEIEPGGSITLMPKVYHMFKAKDTGGVLICGEVSTVNDDHSDNCFAEKAERFTAIEEDEEPVHLLCNEYSSAPGCNPCT